MRELLSKLVCRLVGREDADAWETACKSQMIRVVRRYRRCDRQTLDLLGH